MKSGIIIGAGGHGKVVLEIIREIGGIEVKGFINIYDNEISEVMGYPIVGNPHNLSALKSVDYAFFAIGDNYKRGEWVKKVKASYEGLEYKALIHPKSIVARGVKIGEGSIVCAGAVLQTCSKVHSFCIVNTLALLEHDGVMEDLSSLAPHSCTGGGVWIGRYTAIGLNATLLQRIKVGEHTVIGAGAVVTHDLRDHIVAYGSPARAIRERVKGESYL